MSYLKQLFGPWQLFFTRDHKQNCVYFPYLGPSSNFQTSSSYILVVLKYSHLETYLMLCWFRCVHVWQVWCTREPTDTADMLVKDMHVHTYVCVFGTRLHPVNVLINDDRFTIGIADRLFSFGQTWKNVDEIRYFEMTLEIWGLGQALRRVYTTVPTLTEYRICTVALSLLSLLIFFSFQHGRTLSDCISLN